MEATDHQIHALVYELYGLTEAEIRIVEGRLEGFGSRKARKDFGIAKGAKGRENAKGYYEA